jgi:MerR family transcriptional regulator, copper efflux regulator
MTAITIESASRQSGLSEPTLRYDEEDGLIGPITGDAKSGHRRYGSDDVVLLQALACMRALGVGIEDLRTYQANRAHGRSAAGEQRDLLVRHAQRIAADIVIQRTRLDDRREKAALWDARARDDGVAEVEAPERVGAAFCRMEVAG